jgi:hypothetical protein
MNDKLIKAWHSTGGSLMVSEQVPGVTQELPTDSREWYNGVWFVCETVSRTGAEHIARAMGWEWCERKPKEEPTP